MKWTVCTLLMLVALLVGCLSQALAQVTPPPISQKEADEGGLKLRLLEDVYLRQQTPLEPKEGADYLIFPNLKKKPYYENKKLREAIAKEEAEPEPNFAKLQALLYDYVQQFGIDNFRKQHDLDMLWKLGQVEEILRDTTMALYFYRLALNNNSRFYKDVKLHYEDLAKRYDNRYVDLDYYYKILAARLETDSLAPPKGVLLNMGANVNTKAPDYAPYVHPSGQMLIFTSRRKDYDEVYPPDMLRNEDLYYVLWDELYEVWANAKPFEDVINSRYNEGSGCLNERADTLFFTRCDAPDGFGNCDLYLAEWEAGEWVRIVNLGETINSEYWDSQPSLSPDGQTLFFSSNRDGGFGRTDLYACRRQPDGSWGTPFNLGPSINTIEDEVTPFMHPIYNTLYFSSTGHLKNRGGFDIFKSRNMGDHWETPLNLGPLVNTPRDEYYFTLDQEGATLFYANAQPENPRNFDLYSFELPMAARPDAITPLNGYLIDEATGEPLTGIVVALDMEENVEIEPLYLNEYGYFEFRLINNRQYKLLILGEDAVRVPRRSAAGRDTVISDIKRSVRMAKPLVLEAVTFARSSAELNEAARQSLDHMAAFLQTYPGCTLVVNGHTDSDGKAETNLRLSRERAENIRDYLLEQTQWPQDRIKAVGWGESRPVFPNNTDEHKAFNRRVTFELTYPLEANPFLDTDSLLATSGLLLKLNLDTLLLDDDLLLDSLATQSVADGEVEDWDELDDVQLMDNPEGWDDREMLEGDDRKAKAADELALEEGEDFLEKASRELSEEEVALDPTATEEEELLLEDEMLAEFGSDFLEGLSFGDDDELDDAELELEGWDLDFEEMDGLGGLDEVTADDLVTEEEQAGEEVPAELEGGLEEDGLAP